MVDLNCHFKTNKNLFSRDGLMRVDRYALNLSETINIEIIALKQKYEHRFTVMKYFS